MKTHLTEAGAPPLSPEFSFLLPSADELWLHYSTLCHGFTLNYSCCLNLSRSVHLSNRKVRLNFPVFHAVCLWSFWVTGLTHDLMGKTSKFVSFTIILNRAWFCKLTFATSHCLPLLFLKLLCANSRFYTKLFKDLYYYGLNMYSPVRLPGALAKYRLNRLTNLN